MTQTNTRKCPRKRVGGGIQPTIHNGQLTTAPVSLPDPSAPVSRPEFIRLCAPGQRCPWTGLSRSALNALILPAPENNYKPLVKSFVLRKKGARTGIRLIDFTSLLNYIRQHEQLPGEPSVQEEAT
jgi:hypothetical protein